MVIEASKVSLPFFNLHFKRFQLLLDFPANFELGVMSQAGSSDPTEDATAAAATKVDKLKVVFDQLLIELCSKLALLCKWAITVFLTAKSCSCTKHKRN